MLFFGGRKGSGYFTYEETIDILDITEQIDIRVIYNETN